MEKSKDVLILMSTSDNNHAVVRAGTVFYNGSASMSNNEATVRAELNYLMQDSSTKFIDFYDKNEDTDTLINKDFIVTIT